MKWVKSKIRIKGKYYGCELPAPKTKRREYSKIITAVLVAFAIICVFADYTLTAVGLEAPHDLTKTVLTTATIQLSGYFAKSFAEKNSRNMFGIDENGERIDKDNV